MGRGLLDSGKEKNKVVALATLGRDGNWEGIDNLRIRPKASCVTREKGGVNSVGG
jgi:hypothetical protein